MINSFVIVCPICGKKTYIHIENGGYLDSYPVRVYCKNCRTLITGKFIMNDPLRGDTLIIDNSELESLDYVTKDNFKINAEYKAQISGELPCPLIKDFDGVPGGISPFLEASRYLGDDIVGRIERLKSFSCQMQEWNSWRKIAFQLVDDGSLDFLPQALNNKLDDYDYPCDNYLKSLHCLQSVIQKESKYLFTEEPLELKIRSLLYKGQHLDQLDLLDFCNRIGGEETLIKAYRKLIEIFANFMEIYPNLLPAETYLSYNHFPDVIPGISTCSFQDLKTFYQDSYETILSLYYIPTALDNIEERNSFLKFDQNWQSIFSNGRKYQSGYMKNSDEFDKYLSTDNGFRLGNVNNDEYWQNLVNIPGSKDLRNGIGHNNVTFDGLYQTITAYDRKDPKKIRYQSTLMEMAIDCIGLVKSSILMEEIVLLLLRHMYKETGSRSLISPKYYPDSIKPNDKCPCGSGLKYKKCCQPEIRILKRENAIIK